MVEELKEATLRKLKNFILRERPELSLNAKGIQDISQIEVQANAWYVGNKYEFTLGKELLGKTKKYLQDTKKMDPEKIMDLSDGLKCEEFSKTLQNLAGNDIEVA